MSAAPLHERLSSVETRLNAVEGWMESFKLQMTDVGNEVKANTRLTEEIHGKTEEVYELFDKAKRGFAVLGAVGNACWKVGRATVRVVEFLGRLAKPLFWLFAIIAASLTWWKTGSWHMPDWWSWFQ